MKKSGVSREGTESKRFEPRFQQIKLHEPVLTNSNMLHFQHNTPFGQPCGGSLQYCTLVESASLWTTAVYSSMNAYFVYMYPRNNERAAQSFYSSRLVSWRGVCVICTYRKGSPPRLTFPTQG